MMHLLTYLTKANHYSRYATKGKSLYQWMITQVVGKKNTVESRLRSLLRSNIAGALWQTWSWRRFMPMTSNSQICLSTRARVATLLLTNMNLRDTFYYTISTMSYPTNCCLWCFKVKRSGNSQSWSVSIFIPEYKCAGSLLNYSGIIAQERRLCNIYFQCDGKMAKSCKSSLRGSGKKRYN